MDERLIRGATVIGAEGPIRAEIRVQGGRITGVDTRMDPAGCEVVDATDLYVLPGAIDGHGHQWEPGFTSPPDFRDATASAAVGGVTTLLDHPLTTPLVVTLSEFESKRRLGSRTSLIDFGLHAGASPAYLGELRGLWAAGATGIKVFTCPTGTLLDGFDDPARLDDLFDELRSIGARALVHAEDASVLASTAAALTTANQASVASFPEWHSLAAEQSAVGGILELAERHGVEVLIVHASHPSIVNAVTAARSRGVAAFVETCPHYLVLADSDLAEQGAWAMTAPPVRDVPARERLRRQIRDATIDTIGSDHCAIGRQGKDGAGMTEIIPGVPSLDLFLPLLLDLVAGGSLDWQSLIRATAATPARLFGLRQKGAIAVGNDADLVFVDANREWTVRAADLPGSAGWSPYEGRLLRGSVVETWSRGVPVARGGQPIGRPGHGRFIARAA